MNGKKDKLLLWIVRIMFLIQLMVLMIFNLTHLRYIVDYDGSVPVAQAMQIWEQKRIFIQNWEYQTTMGLDSPVLISALLYGLVGDGCLAYGISNNIWLILLLILINDVYQEYGIKKVYRYVGFIILLTPYSMGNLGYMPVLFAGPAFYITKIFISILCFDICLKLYKGASLKRVCVLCMIFFLLVLLTAVSSGIYVLVCGIFPIAVCEYLHIVHENDWKRMWNNRIALLALTVVGFCIGLFIQKRVGFVSRDSTMTLMFEGGFVGNIGACIVGILELFGAVPGSDNIGVLSLEGITYLSGMVIVILLMFVFAFCLRKSVRQFDYFLIWGWLAFVCNMIILILSNTRYGAGIFETRYHIFTMLPLLLIVPKYLEQINFKRVFTQTIAAGVVFSLLMINIQHYKEYYAYDNFYDSIEYAIGFAEKQDADALVVLGEDMIITGRVARLCKTDIPVIVYATWENVHRWGGSVQKLEDYSGIQKYVVLTLQNGYDQTVEEIKSTWSLCDVIGDWQLYIGVY